MHEQLMEEIMSYNKEFVDQKEYEPFLTSKFPDKRMVVLTCMDTRLVELLPRAMNLKNGDVKVIKSAGAVVSHPFGSIMRSMLVAIYELKATEIAIVGHYECGMASIDPQALLDKAIQSGVDPQDIQMMEACGIDLHKWLSGFDSVEESVIRSVKMVRQHPLLPKKIAVHGLIIDPKTGQLNWLVNGYPDSPTVQSV
jgi:carbonic anhydrase